MRDLGPGRAFRRRGATTWTAEWPLGKDASGRYRYGRRSGYRSEREARTYAASQAAKRQRPDERHQTVRGHIEAWLADYAATKSVRTYQSYAGQAQRYVLPQIGAVRLTQLTSGHIQGIYRAMRARGLSEATVLKVHRQLKLMLRDRVPWDEVASPSPPKQEQAAHSGAEIAALLAAAEGTPIYGFLLLAVTAGLAKGELRGLQWRDLDGDLLRIQRTRQVVVGQGDIILPVKRERRARRVALLPEVLTALGPRGEPNAWVFDLTAGQIRGWLRRVRAGANLTGEQLHILRHTFATILLAAGGTVPEASAALGHATPAVTLGVYAHAVPGRERETAARVGGVVRSLFAHGVRESA